jgi:hypothetical protein
MRALLFIVLVLLYSCGDDFTKQSKLGKLRVLAIQADTPEINAAGTVTLTPLISFVDGGSTTLNYSWVACPDPGIDVGAPVSCDSATTALKLSGSGTFNTATLAGTYFTGNATAIAVAIPATAFTYLATLSTNIQFNGLDYIALVTYSDPTSGSTTTALKTIKLSTRTNPELNVNPTTGAIQFNGSALATYPTAEGTMTVASLSAAETYSVKTTTGTSTITEDMYISWHSNVGEFTFNRTDVSTENKYKPEGTTGIFVIVYRDGRGGITTSTNSF